MAELNDYRQELKERILELAMQEFSLRGLRDIKMDDMAHKLRISKRTLYEIYADKESLLLEGLQRHRQKNGTGDGTFRPKRREKRGRHRGEVL